MESKTFFISGHVDLGAGEFERHYLHAIQNAVDDPNSNFVIGDATGCDSLAMTYLAALAEHDPALKDRVTIYHLFNRARNNFGFYTRGGFATEEDRDDAMTRASQVDILYVRPEDEMRKRFRDNYNPNYVCGTEKNRRRREKYVGGGV